MHKLNCLAAQGLKDRRNLSGTPELGLKNAITHRENVDDYGHLVYEALNKVWKTCEYMHSLLLAQGLLLLATCSCIGTCFLLRNAEVSTVTVSPYLIWANRLKYGSPLGQKPIWRRRI